MVNDRIGQTNTNGAHELAVEKSLKSLLVHHYCISFFLTFFYLSSLTLVCYLRRYGILHDSLPPFFFFFFFFVSLLSDCFSTSLQFRLFTYFNLYYTTSCTERDCGRFFFPFTFSLFPSFLFFSFFFLVSNFRMEIY